jgi:hypothetical protein
MRRNTLNYVLRAAGNVENLEDRDLRRQPMLPKMSGKTFKRAKTMVKPK